MLTPTSWYSKSFRGCSFCVIAKTFFSLDLIDFEVRMLPVGLMKPFLKITGAFILVDWSLVAGCL